MYKQFLIIALLATSASAFADRERIDETKDASADGFVRITVVRGELSVEGWDRNAIRVRGLLDEQAEAFIFDVDGNDAVIEVKLPHNLHSWWGKDGSDLEINVPTGSDVDISVVSTDTTVRDVLGGLEVGGVSGDVRVTTARERVDLTTVSGDIELRDGKGRIELKSVSGDIEADELAGDISMHTVSGDVIARDVGDELDIESVSGDIEIDSATYRVLSGHSVSGDVDVMGQMLAGGRFDFDTVSGSVRVRFDGDIDAHFDLETGSGSIKNRITNDRPKTSKYVRDETLRFETGDGKGEVTIGTRSGDIVISR